MGYAVIQTVPEYRPEGDPTRTPTTEFVHWIFEKKKEADDHKKDLLLARSDAKIVVKKVTEESWTPANLSSKKKPVKKEAPQ
jgi:hypothetical protein